MKRSLLSEEDIDRQKEKPMRKVIFLIHLSLDGFTAGPNDELDWIAYDHELEQDAHILHDRTDAVIWGRRTYEGMAGYWLTVPDNPAFVEIAKIVVSVRCAISIASLMSARLKVSSPSVITTSARRPWAERIFSSQNCQIAS